MNPYTSGFSFLVGCMMKRSLTLAVRLVLGVTFLISAAAKLISPDAFANSLTSFGLLPSGSIPFFTYVVPATESIVAVGLLSGVQLRRVALVTSVLLVVFLAAAFSAAISGAAVENCGCFGELYRSGLGVGFFLRNGFLLLLAVLLVWTTESPGEVERQETVRDL